MSQGYWVVAFPGYTPSSVDLTTIDPPTVGPALTSATAEVILTGGSITAEGQVAVQAYVYDGRIICEFPNADRFDFISSTGNCWLLGSLISGPTGTGITQGSVYNATLIKQDRLPAVVPAVYPAQRLTPLDYRLKDNWVAISAGWGSSKWMWVDSIREVPKPSSESWMNFAPIYSAQPAVGEKYYTNEWPANAGEVKTFFGYCAQQRQSGTENALVWIPPQSIKTITAIGPQSAAQKLQKNVYIDEDGSFNPDQTAFVALDMLYSISRTQLDDDASVRIVSIRPSPTATLRTYGTALATYTQITNTDNSERYWRYLSDFTVDELKVRTLTTNPATLAQTNIADNYGRAGMLAPVVSAYLTDPAALIRTTLSSEVGWDESHINGQRLAPLNGSGNELTIRRYNQTQPNAILVKDGGSVTEMAINPGEFDRNITSNKSPGPFVGYVIGIISKTSTIISSQWRTEVLTGCDAATLQPIYTPSSYVTFTTDRLVEEVPPDLPPDHEPKDTWQGIFDVARPSTVPENGSLPWRVRAEIVFEDEFGDTTTLRTLATIVPKYVPEIKPSYAIPRHTDAAGNAFLTCIGNVTTGQKNQRDPVFTGAEGTNSISSSTSGGQLFITFSAEYRPILSLASIDYVNWQASGSTLYRKYVTIENADRGIYWMHDGTQWYKNMLSNIQFTSGGINLPSDMAGYTLSATIHTLKPIRNVSYDDTLRKWIRFVDKWDWNGSSFTRTATAQRL